MHKNKFRFQNKIITREISICSKIHIVWKGLLTYFIYTKHTLFMSLNKFWQNTQIFKTGVVKSLTAKFTSHLKYPFRSCIKNTNYLPWLTLKCMFQREYNWHNNLLLATISANSTSNNYQWNCPHFINRRQKNSKFIQVTVNVYIVLW